MEIQYFDHWSECAPCDMCGKNAWGFEGWNEEMEKADVTVQLCKACLEKLAKESL